METFVAVYFLIGGVLTLPVAKDLSYFQIISAVLVWPLIVTESFITMIRGK